MMRADVIDLITETASAHGVHQAVTETARTVYCTVQSVSRSAFYTGLNAGVKPEFVFVLALAEEAEAPNRPKVKPRLQSRLHRLLPMKPELMNR